MGLWFTIMDSAVISKFNLKKPQHSICICLSSIYLPICVTIHLCTYHLPIYVSIICLSSIEISSYWNKRQTLKSKEGSARRSRFSHSLPHLQSWYTPPQFPPPLLGWHCPVLSMISCKGTRGKLGMWAVWPLKVVVKDEEDTFSK